MLLHIFSRHEIGRAFRRPATWAALAMAALLSAVYFMLLLVRYLEHQDQLSKSGVTVEILTRFYSASSLMILLVVPIVTMTALTTDRQSQLLRFYFSTQLSSRAIVFGKLAGVGAVMAPVLLLLAVLPATLWWGARIDFGVLLTCVLGLVLFTGFHLALGVLASALSSSAITAAMLTLVVSLCLWFAETAARIDPESQGASSVSSLAHMRGFYQGILASHDIAYFVIGTITFVALTLVVIDCERQA